MYHSGHHHGGNHGQNSGHEAYCVCPTCNRAMRHVPGVPCNARRCNVCGHTLFKSYDPAYAGNLQTVEGEDAADYHHQPVKRTDYPLVNPTLCIACDSCFDICPVEAIEYRDGKAFIIEEKCRNCKACVNVCPTQAIER